MQTNFPHKVLTYLRAAIAGAMVLGLATACAQVLARPGWAGSGVSMEPWWRHAVIYRIDPARFQDSDMDGTGDIQGITKRLNYLQSLGVDAILIDDVPLPPVNPDPNMPPPDDGFDDLFRAAAGVHLRVLVNVSVPPRRTNVEDAAYLSRARMWLSRGAAGLYVPTAELVNASSNEAAVYFIKQMRGFIDSMPGEHVLLADQVPDHTSAVAEVVVRSAQLILTAPIDLASQGGQAEAADLRRQLTDRLGNAANASGAGPVPVLHAARVDAKLLKPEQALGLRRSLAVMLLGSHTAVMLDFGQELGLQRLGNAEGREAAEDRAPLMQWTPNNLTQLPPLPPAEEKPAPSKGGGYGAFKEYVKPLPRNLFPPPKLPSVTINENPAPVDVNMLPGFSGGTREAGLHDELERKIAVLTAPNAATANVAMEENDRGSMLTLYRRLIQLHHANASLRSGSQQMVDEDAAGAVVWLRQPPPAANAATVLAVCNMSGKTLEMPLSQIAPLRLREAILRDLQPGSGAAQALGRETMVKVPAYDVALVAVER